MISSQSSFRFKFLLPVRTRVRPRSWAGLLPAAGLAAGLAAALAAGLAQAQTLVVPNQAVPTAQSFQGSVPAGQATGQNLDLSLDDAIQRGLKANLGFILSGTQTLSARGLRLDELQALLPRWISRPRKL